jgi:hypothetical protein
MENDRAVMGDAGLVVGARCRHRAEAHRLGPSLRL